jgi:SAM-dependent methyltransferase
MSRRGRDFLEISDTSDEWAPDSLDLYEAFARYYDKWYGGYTDDLEFYLDMAEMTGGPVLECMCGTGRVLIPLATAGYRVVGVDRSPAMLDICTERIDLQEDQIQSRIEIIQEDVRDFRAETRFKLAIIPFNSFLHLLSTKDQEMTLRNIHDHLAQEGLLILSIFNPDLSRPEEVLRHKGTTVTDEGEIISRFESQSFDRSQQTTTVHFFYDISKQDKPLRRVTSCFTLRYIFYREMIELLERCDYDVLEVYGDHLLNPFRKSSELMIFVARRA